MMLSRVAESLFWVGRYIERAENVARLLDAARRMSSLPKETGRAPTNEWSSILIAAGSRDVFEGDLENVSAKEAAYHLLFDEKNPSSVINCITNARENARSVRFALTKDCWEALNSAWAEGRLFDPDMYSSSRLPDMIDWVKDKSNLFRGSFYGTMVREDGYYFLGIGTTLERVDSTARLLDVKYHILLPSITDVGSMADHYQWLSLLQAAAAQRAYLAMTRSDITARGVAEFLILEPRYPRSILFNLNRTVELIDELAKIYGQCIVSYDEITALRDECAASTIDSIVDFGLHEYLTQIIKRNYGIADLLATAYSFRPIVTEEEADEALEAQ